MVGRPRRQGRPCNLVRGGVASTTETGLHRLLQLAAARLVPVVTKIHAIGRRNSPRRLKCNEPMKGLADTPASHNFFRHAASTVERCKIALTYSDKDEHDR